MLPFIFVLLALEPVLGSRLYNGLRVKFGWSDALADREYFFSLPRTLLEAEAEGWIRYERPPGPLKELRMYCPPGRAVCPLYDTAGFVAGLQLAVPQEEFESPPTVSPGKKLVRWSAESKTGEPGRQYWTLTQFFVSEESLKAGAGPLAGNGATLQDGGVWVVTGPSGKLLMIPTNETEIAKTLFKKQNCIPNMGTHYYYNMTPSMRCEDHLPWFALTSRGELVGTGFQVFGRLPKQKHQDWFERPYAVKEAAKLSIPFAPECLADWASSYGMISLHIYYIDRPWTLRCEDGASAAPAGFASRAMLAGVRYASAVADEFKKVFGG